MGPCPYLPSPEFAQSHATSFGDQPQLAESAQILINARFLEDFALRCTSDIAMQLSVRKLNSYPADLYLQSFQILLVGYTDIRAGSARHGQMSFWTVQSLSNMEIKIFGAEDGPDTIREIDPTLWEGKALPATAVPSFSSCNVDRKYELEILMGFQCRSSNVC